MQFLYNSALSSNEVRALYIHCVITQRGLQPGYTLQRATGDQCTIAFSACFVYLIPGSHFTAE